MSKLRLEERMTIRWCLLATVMLLLAAAAGASDWCDLRRVVEANGRNALMTSRCVLALRRGCRATGKSRVRAAALWRSCMLGSYSYAGLTFNTEGRQPSDQHAALPSLAIVSSGDWSPAQVGWEGSRNSAGIVKGPWSGRGRRPRYLSPGVNQETMRDSLAMTHCPIMRSEHGENFFLSTS